MLLQRLVMSVHIYASVALWNCLFYFKPWHCRITWKKEISQIYWWYKQWNALQDMEIGVCIKHADINGSELNIVNRILRYECRYHIYYWDVSTELHKTGKQELQMESTWYLTEQNILGEKKTNHLHPFDTIRTAQETTRPNFFYFCVCILCHCNVLFRAIA